MKCWIKGLPIRFGEFVGNFWTKIFVYAFVHAPICACTHTQTHTEDTHNQTCMHTHTHTHTVAHALKFVCPVYYNLSGQYVYKAVTYPYPTDVTIRNDLGVIEVDSLLVINEYIFIQKSSQFASWLYVSWKRQPFKMAFFPRNCHPEVKFCVMFH